MIEAPLLATGIEIALLATLGASLLAGGVSGIVAKQQIDATRKTSRKQRLAFQRFAEIEEHAGRQRARRIFASRQALRASGGGAVGPQASDTQAVRDIRQEASRRAFILRARGEAARNLGKQQEQQIKLQQASNLIGILGQSMSLGGVAGGLGGGSGQLVGSGLTGANNSAVNTVGTLPLNVA